MKEATFMGWRCDVLIDSHKKIMLVDKLTGEPIAVATKIVPGAELQDDEVLIKSYSENEGMLSALASAGVVEPTGKTIPSGFVELDICKLLI